MTQVAPMTKETETKLTNLLMEVVDSGEEPVGALSTIAKQAQLTPDQIRLMGRAYNTGVTLSQLKEGNTVQEKAAVVSLVDPEEVIKNLFPDKVDSPVEQINKEAVSQDYNAPPIIDTKPKRIYNDYLLTKAAKEIETVFADPHGKEYLNKRAHETEIKDTLDEGYRVINDCIYKSARAFDSLRDYFERAGAININYVRKNAAAVYGDIADDILDHISQGLKHTKFASIDNPAVNWDKSPYSFIKDAIDAINQHNELKGKLDFIKNEFAAKCASKKKVNTDGPIIGSIVDYLEKDSAAVVGGLAGGAGLGIARETMRKLMPASEHDQVRQMVQKLDSGGHAASLQRIKMQSFLTELMLSDPVVSEYDPNEVFEAFNYLNEIAPRAIQHPVIAKSLIRRYLSQGSTIDAFEASQLTTIDRDLMKQTIEPIKSEWDLLGAPSGSDKHDDFA